jgi:hypothetical protein
MAESLKQGSFLIIKQTGEIIGCRLNAPGSWHDARVACPIFKKLCDQTPEGYYLVTDTVFPCGTNQILGRIRAPLKAGTTLPDNPAERAAVKAFDCQLLSYHQTAEWDNRAIQGMFGHLQVPLPINYTDHRGDILECCSQLYNVCAQRVGFNQICTVYMPIWRANKEQENIWLHFEDILFSIYSPRE